MPVSLASLLGASRVIPVVTLDDAEHALPLARALAAGGITAIEVTLRTPAGLAAIRSCVRQVQQFGLRVA